MKKQISFLLFTCALIINGSLFANNIQLSNSHVASINVAGQYAEIQFNISWENSWRDASNWDAVWVFIKYHQTGNTGPWQHATLHTSGHLAPASATIQTPADGKGIFIYRSGLGSGTANFANVQLRWNYGVDGLASVNSVDIEAFGVEMVHVPQGSFFVGDGQTSGPEVYAHFEAGATGAAYQFTSENAIVLGGGTASSLGNNNAVQMFDFPGCSGCLGGSGDDFNDATTQNLPAAFPKGFDAFYCMKYELTQQQFVDMLNKSTATQQALLASQSNYVLLDGMSLVASRHGISLGGGTYSTTQPYLPMVFMDWIHAAAYADWAALRPMTELEFEKACRGPGAPVLNEFAWGNANIDLSNNFAFSNLGMANENITSGYDAGGVNGNCGVIAGSQNMATVARVGIFAANPASTGRVSSGASFWGIMELSGHAWERAVSVGHTEGRKFTGLEGDGNLATSGHADVNNWPGTFSGSIVNSNVGVGYRGGALRFPSPNLERNARVSSRRLASGYWLSVIRDDGGRFVRSAN